MRSPHRIDAYLELDEVPELPEEPVLPDDDELPELEPDDEPEPLLDPEPPLLPDEPPPLPPPPPPPLRFQRSVKVDAHDVDASRCVCCAGRWSDARSELSGMATAETVVSSSATAAKTRFHFMIRALRV